MELKEVSADNIQIYLNLVQCYEGEFSSITKKKPNANGLFELDTIIEKYNKGFILYDNELPVGIAAIRIKNEKYHEMLEFYIVPFCRKQSMGQKFAHLIFKQYPGKWEIKQITGAEYASVFWRKVISNCTNNTFEEEQYEDEYWGKVTRQLFEIK
ncbi:MAG: hypothetical protein C0403_08410 [Desulfobacterium sp.]|nr:hypothetical protein [Desulfobacterium sp.]